MKSIKILVVLLVSMVAVNVSQAQVQFAMGIKGGPNFCKIDVNDPDATWKGRTGFHGGAFALIKLTKIGIQPEIIFSQQGSKVTWNSQNYEANFSYVNVPVILKLYTVGGINLQMGPQFGFLTTADSDYNPIANEPEPGFDLKSAYKKSDVSLAIGAGWDLPFGLTLDARYNLGLSKIQNDSNLEQAKNQVFQISAGIKFIKLGK